MKENHALDFIRCPICGRAKFPLSPRWKHYRPEYICPAFVAHFFDRLDAVVGLSSLGAKT